MVSTKRLIRARTPRKETTTFTRPEGAGNFDNMDDKNIVDQVNIKRGTVDLDPTAEKDIVNKKYVDNSIASPYDFIDFNTEYVDGQQEGRLQWNTEDGTLEVGMPGGVVNLQIGQEHLIRTRNDSGVNILNGQPVRILGGLGSQTTIELANATDTTLGVIGIATEDIDDGHQGFITTAGLVRELNTSSWVVGTTLFLGITDGAVTDSQPIENTRSVFLGTVIRQHVDEGIIYVTIDNKTFIEELSGNTDSSGNPIIRINNSTKEFITQKLVTEAGGDVTNELLRTGIQKTISGLDSSDSNAFKIGDATAGKDPFGTHNWMKIDTSGNLTMTGEIEASEKMVINGGGSDSQPTLHFVEVDNGWNIRHEGVTNTLRFSNVLGGTDWFILDSSGNLTLDGELDMGTNKIVGVVDPTADQEVATKKYVDDNGSVSPLTTKGDVYTYSTLDARLAVGSNDQVLTAASGETTGLKWGTALARSGTKFVSMTVEAPTSDDDLTICRFNEAVTITKVVTVVTGSSSPTNGWSLKQGTNRTSGTGVVTAAIPSTTSSTTTGDVITSGFNDATIPADSFLWYDGNGTTGTCDTWHVTVFFTTD